MNLIVYNQYQYLWNYITVRTLKKQKLNQAFSRLRLLRLFDKLLVPRQIANKDNKRNKRPMGHIAHLRKQFKSINTDDYIITLIKRRKKKPLLTS